MVFCYRSMETAPAEQRYCYFFIINKCLDVQFNSLAGALQAMIVSTFSIERIGQQWRFLLRASVAAVIGPPCSAPIVQRLSFLFC